MSRPHLKYRNIHRRAVKAADNLFSNKPWSGTDEEKHQKFQTFLDKTSAAYDVPPVVLEYRHVNIPESQVTAPYYGEGTLVLTRYSALNLFIGFRIHLQAMGVVPGASAFDQDYEDAFGWACSLFYTVRKRLFRKAVRSGRIQGVSPEQLLRSDSTYQPPPSEEAVSQAVDGPNATLLDRYQRYVENRGGSLATVRKHVRVAHNFSAWVRGGVLEPYTDEAVHAWVDSQNLTQSSRDTYRGSALQFVRWARYAAEVTTNTDVS